MGQRLVISVYKNKSEIATLYYHWSAYTKDALFEIQNVIDYLYSGNTSKSIDEIQLGLLKYCESNGGGASRTDFEYIQNKFKDIEVSEDVSRNEGLIAISPSGRKDFHFWAEGFGFIDLDNDIVEFHVYNRFDSVKDYITEMEINPKEITIVPVNCNIMNFKVDDIDNVINEIICADSATLYKFNDHLVQFIE